MPSLSALPLAAARRYWSLGVNVSDCCAKRARLFLRLDVRHRSQDDVDSPTIHEHGVLLLQ